MSMWYLRNFITKKEFWFKIFLLDLKNSKLLPMCVRKVYFKIIFLENNFMLVGRTNL